MYETQSTREYKKQKKKTEKQKIPEGGKKSFLIRNVFTASGVDTALYPVSTGIFSRS